MPGPVPMLQIGGEELSWWRGLGGGCRPSGFEAQPYHFLDLCPWNGYFSFIISKRGILAVAAVPGTKQALC